MIVFIVMMIIGMVLVCIGLKIKKQKTYSLILGYSTLSPEEKEKLDKEKLCNFVGKFFYLLSAIFFLSGILFGFISSGILMIAAVINIVFFIVLFFSLSYPGVIGSSEKIRKQLIMSSISIVFLILLSNVLLLVIGIGPGVKLRGDTLIIKSSYKFSVKKENIYSIELKDSIPKVLEATDGNSSEEIWEGFFILENIGKAQLFVNRPVEKYIYLYDKNRNLLIINMATIEETQYLYRRIMKWRSK